MKVSIVTICFNAKKTIKNTIESVLSQDYPDIEYIIIDGASTDGTQEIVKSFGNKIDKFISEKDNGLFDALNKGIKIASGEIVGILHADDVFANNSIISKVVENMKEYQADACWGDLVFVDKNNPEKIVRYWQSCTYKKGLFKKGWMPPHTTFFAKKSVFEKYGYYDLKFDMAADYELMLRFLEKYNLPSCYIPEVLVKMRTGGVSDRSLKNIKRIAKSNIDAYKAWRANGLKVNSFSILIVKPFSKLWQSFKKNRNV